MSYKPAKLQKCPRCNGTGITTERISRAPYMPGKMKKCRKCGGAGTITDKERKDE